MRFLPGDPHTVLVDDTEMETARARLVGGGVALAVAVFAHRLMRKEAGLD